MVVSDVARSGFPDRINAGTVQVTCGVTASGCQGRSYQRTFVSGGLTEADVDDGYLLTRFDDTNYAPTS